ncbi:MAG: type II CRISPR RNA-guided endonuclease Cas9 [Candidatus Sumerlaeia bacterium]|nr:type II CRISPR RNA-guided endonuclease Cas9 [Candidatus Sumerlaeia bacterium]
MDRSEVNSGGNPTPRRNIGPWRLGLDAGSDSLGWAVVLVDEAAPDPLVDCGVRIFPAGTNKDKQGNEHSKNEERRGARQMRRQLARRHGRRRTIARLLAVAGLLPTDPAERKRLQELDPYTLRARALSEALPPGELGRALYHAGKRRGFRSNRRADRKSSDSGKVQEGIEKLKEYVSAAGCRTVGEYLATLHPLDERRRGRYLHRDQVREEFGLICAVQRSFGTLPLDDAALARLELAIFHQRPLRAMSGKIGKCPLEPGERRAPKWDWFVEEVRIQQEVANLRVYDSKLRSERMLRDDEKKQLEEELHTRDKLTFDQLRKALGMAEQDRVNLESVHRDSLRGHAVEAGLRKIFKKRWEKDADLLRHCVWPCFNELEDAEFDRRAETEWNISAVEITKLKGLPAPDGYAAYSLKALRKLLPHLQRGMDLYEARRAVYGEAAAPECVDLVPPADPEEVRNPVVLRTMAETRKVVNELIREYGKPAEVVIEMARETKGSVDKRNEDMKRIRDNEREREAIRKAFRDRGYPEPRGGDFVKYRLWVELGGPESAVCPYTGERITFDLLFGDAPRFDIEHIIPYSRCFDDSFLNKTLCLHTENRAVKKNRTPFEAYGDNPRRFEEIMTRVRHTKMRFNKVALFSLRGEALQEKVDKFKARQLTDTSYAARLIRESLQKLYPDGAKHHVRTSTGQMTATLRREWGLNGMLPIPPEAEADEKLDAGEKHRLDHRHHAVDAIAIALTTQAHIQNLARRYDRGDGERFHLPKPWERIREDAQKQIDAINVSFAPEHKVSGQINKGTNYGLIKHGALAGKFVQRVAVEEMSEPQLKRVIDPVVAATLKAWMEERDRWRERQAEERKKPYKERVEIPAPDFPRMPVRSAGKFAPQIKTVRIWETIGKPIAIPAEDPTRFVESGGNHHATFFEVPDARKGRRIVVRVCTLHEAYQRRRRGEPIVRRTDAEHPNATFLFSLMINDMVMHKGEGGVERLYRVQQLSAIREDNLYLVCRAHVASLIKFETQMLRMVSFPLPLAIRKVHVDVLGRVSPKNGWVRS